MLLSGNGAAIKMEHKQRVPFSRQETPELASGFISGGGGAAAAATSRLLSSEHSALVTRTRIYHTNQHTTAIWIKFRLVLMTLGDIKNQEDCRIPPFTTS